MSLALVGCGASERVDCEHVRTQFWQCFEDTSAMGNDQDRLPKCMPYSAPMRITGTWATSFEYNQFFEGRSVAPEEAMRSPEKSTYLDVSGTPLTEYEGSPQTSTVVDIEFIGRRPVCDVLHDYRVVMVDRLISRRVIERRAYE